MSTRQLRAMKYKKFLRKHRRWAGLTITVLSVTAVTLFGLRSLSTGDLTTTAHAQQSVILEQRLGQIEQRFNYIESRISRLESESRLPGTLPGSATSQTELNLIHNQMDTMRTEIDALRVRTGE